MSAWNGPAHKGAMRGRRKAKRLEAEDRNARTPVGCRRVTREGPPGRRAPS